MSSDQKGLCYHRCLCRHLTHGQAENAGKEAVGEEDEGENEENEGSPKKRGVCGSCLGCSDMAN